MHALVRALCAVKLVATVVSYARAQGVPRITCEVNVEPPNPVSLKFHERRGFREIGFVATERAVSYCLTVRGATGRPSFLRLLPYPTGAGHPGSTNSEWEKPASARAAALCTF